MTDTQRLREIQERHGSSIFGCVPEFCTICFLLKQIAALRAMPTPAGEDAELAHRLRECESTLRGAQMVYTADCVSKAADHIEALSAKPGPASQQEPRVVCNYCSDGYDAISGQPCNNCGGFE